MSQPSTRISVRNAIPYLCVRGAAEALRFYKESFGAEIIGDPIVMRDGQIGHAALRLGDCTIFLADEFPESGVQSPLTLGNCTATVVLSVGDVDGFIERAEAAGATVTQAPVDEPYGRTGKLRDPFGQRWIVNAS